MAIVSLISPATSQAVIDSAANAEASEIAAAQSEANALASKNAAALSETNAAASEAAALASKNAAAASEATAITKASEASTSAAAALASENAAETAEANATAQAGIATTKADQASTSEANAAASASTATAKATEAATSAAEAETAADIVVTLYDSFDDRYLGAKASDPTVDNDGNPLLEGALYWRTTAPKVMRVFNGATWQNTAAIASSLEAFNVTVTSISGLTSTNVQAALAEIKDKLSQQAIALAIAL